MDTEGIQKALREKGLTPEKMLEIAKKKLAEARKAKDAKLIKTWEGRIKKF